MQVQMLRKTTLGLMTFCSKAFNHSDIQSYSKNNSVAAGFHSKSTGATSDSTCLNPAGLQSNTGVWILLVWTETL